MFIQNPCQSKGWALDSDLKLWLLLFILNSDLACNTWNKLISMLKKNYYSVKINVRNIGLWGHFPTPYTLETLYITLSIWDNNKDWWCLQNFNQQFSKLKKATVHSNSTLELWSPLLFQRAFRIDVACNIFKVSKCHYYVIVYARVTNLY